LSDPGAAVPASHPQAAGSSHTQRLQKTLEDARIKLDSVISDILGGRRMIEAMIAGQSDSAVMASLADLRIKATREELREALRGRLTAHHRFLLQLYLEQIDSLDRAIARMDEEVKSDLDSFREATEIIQTLPGFDDLST
jgi:transposase